jgi:hypothetical protein
MKQPHRRRMNQQQLDPHGHHEVLSVEPRSTENDLKHFLQAGPVDASAPLDMLLSGGLPLPSSSILQNVTVQPKSAPAPTTVQPVPFGRVACRLSDSALWDIQDNYYKSAGVQAWQNDVPNFITSSAYVAETYAELIVTFLEEYAEHLNPSEPVYIMELAAGSGRLSYMLIQELQKKRVHFKQSSQLDLKYIITDFAENNFRFWNQHDRFQPLIKAGLVDFAIYDPLNDTSIHLHHGQKTLSAEKPAKNPIIIVANYFFDTVRQDVFRIENKRLHEGQVTTTCMPDKLPQQGLPHIDDVKVQFKYRELHGENYYPNSRLNNILRHYKHNLKEASVIFPIGGFDALDKLRGISGNQLVLLSSDKAYSDYSLMEGRHKHTYAIHGGAFSYAVNYDAIGRYFEQGGGTWLTTNNPQSNLETVFCIEMPTPTIGFERLRYLFSEKLGRVNPINSLCHMYMDMSQTSPAEQISYYLSYLRIHLAEPKILSLLTNKITMLLPHIQRWQCHELLTLMEMAWEHFYHCPGEMNLPFCLSQVYYVLEKHELSLARLDDTMHYFGAHETLLYLKGQNYEKLNRFDLARSLYRESIAMNPDFDLPILRLKEIGG